MPVWSPGGGSWLCIGKYCRISGQEDMLGSGWKPWKPWQLWPVPGARWGSDLRVSGVGVFPARRVCHEQPWRQSVIFLDCTRPRPTSVNYEGLPDPTGWSARGKRRKRRSSASTWRDYLSIFAADQTTYAHDVAGDALCVAWSASYITPPGPVLVITHSSLDPRGHISRPAPAPLLTRLPLACPRRQVDFIFFLS